MKFTPMAFSILDAAEVSGIARSGLYEAMKRGDLRAVKHGGRTLILADDLKAWLASLPQYQPRADSDD